MGAGNLPASSHGISPLPLRLGILEAEAYTSSNTGMETLRYSRYTQEFKSWDATRAEFPGHLEIRRFDAVPAAERTSLWQARRRHTPCDVELPKEWDLDALYFRAPEEEPYARRLSELKTPAITRQIPLMISLICLRSPVVPHRWPLPHTPCPATFRNYSLHGDLADPAGGEFALDSAWALRQGSIADGFSDPGRMLTETRKECRDLARDYEQFVSHHMV
jgi:hypothetical protein